MLIVALVVNVGHKPAFSRTAWPGASYLVCRSGRFYSQRHHCGDQIGRCCRETFKGTIFLLALVTAASMMPVEKLPAASWQTALGLGFVSAVFDNIPLTALALKQGGYDWGYLAYAVGFGGSMIWFGSSAGVALSNQYAEAKSVGLWLRHGWHVAVAYVIGFFIMLAVIGWHPDIDQRKQATDGRRTWCHNKSA